MLRIHGPTYRYSGEKISDRIIYIDDHHWNEETQSFPVSKLLENNPNEYLLVFDHLAHDDVLKSYSHIHLPVYLADEVEQFRQQHIITNWKNKTHTFNFSINKPRPHRLKLLEVVSKYNLQNYRHSLPWKNSPVTGISVTDYRIGNEVVMDQGVKNRDYPNALTYQKLLQSQVFEPSCISLITEPCFYERESMITEKTIMAMYGGTLPIWAGGWRLPDVMRDLGFDLFDDILDHSYSTLNDPWQRLEQAIDKNINILNNFNQACNFIQLNIHRLQHNVNLIEQNVFLKLVKAQIDRYPELLDIVKCWKNLIV